MRVNNEKFMYNVEFFTVYNKLHEQYNIVVKSIYSGARWPGFKSWLCHLLAM